MKTIKMTHIDNGSHGYLSISKKDIMLVYNEDELKSISGCSGMDWNRIYLEEDQDASNFIDKCKTMNIDYDIKNSYNQYFSITHNFNYNLFHLKPEINETFKMYDDLIYTIIKVSPKIVVVNKFGEKYKLLVTNPFKHSVFANRICKLIYVKNNGNLNEAIKEAEPYFDDFQHFIKHIYELVENEIPLYAYYRLLKYGASNWGFEENEYQEKIIKTQDACKFYYNS